MIAVVIDTQCRWCVQVVVEHGVSVGSTMPNRGKNKHWACRTRDHTIHHLGLERILMVTNFDLLGIQSNKWYRFGETLDLCSKYVQSED